MDSSCYQQAWDAGWGQLMGKRSHQNTDLCPAHPHKCVHAHTHTHTHTHPHTENGEGMIQERLRKETKGQQSIFAKFRSPSGQT